ncbi:MAG: M48 family metalloprotease, partial [Synechococcus sp. ELA057]
MATTITVQDRLSQVLVSWCGLLSSWAADGSLVSAAESALALNSSNALPGSASLLQSLSTQWAAGEFSSLPPILLLPAEAISGAYGAYATSTDSIYINESWLLTASDEQIAAVLTEELGHFLDAHLNQSDTPGDEGEVFSNLLLSPSAAASSSSADDSIVITVNGTSISAEAATATNTLNIDLSQGPQAIIAKASITDATGLGYY